ncbi:MAG: hypothetical protein IT427_13475 [Pirellulales bacterium]|nr:hypothetical protein [Pirellulales bacterium]
MPKHVCGHGQVENSLLFVQDRWWDEDRSWSRRSGLTLRLASLTGIARTLLRLACPKDRRPLRACVDVLCWHSNYPLKLIGALN